MRGFLLAAGLGSRLRPLTDFWPKPAMPLGFRPIAAAALDTFRRAGIRRVHVNAHHLPEALERALADELHGFDQVWFHRETELLGTGGGLAAGLSDADEEVLVMNGDIVFAPDVERLVSTHRAAGAAVTLVVRDHPEAERFGAVRIAGGGLVGSIAGLPEPATAGHATVFTGVHLLSPAILRRLPARGCIVRQLYQPMLAGGEAIHAIVDARPWADLGTVESYLAANLALAAAAPLVHPSATVGPGARLVRSVVHRGAHVGAGVALADAVVLPGASVTADVSRGVVLPDGRFVPA